MIHNAVINDRVPVIKWGLSWHDTRLNDLCPNVPMILVRKATRLKDLCPNNHEMHFSTSIQCFQRSVVEYRNVSDCVPLCPGHVSRPCPVPHPFGVCGHEGHGTSRLTRPDKIN